MWVNLKSSKRILRLHNSSSSDRKEDQSNGLSINLVRFQTETIQLGTEKIQANKTDFYYYFIHLRLSAHRLHLKLIVTKTILGTIKFEFCNNVLFYLVEKRFIRLGIFKIVFIQDLHH